MKNLIAALGTVLLTAHVASAAPFVATAVGQSTTINFSLTPKDAPGPATATAVVSVGSISNTSLDLFVQLSNTTGALFTEAGITSFGFEVDPDATGAAGTSKGDNDTTGDTDVFGGFGLAQIPSLSMIEICAWAGNGCAGSGLGSLLGKGATDFFVITLNWSTPNEVVQYTLDNFGIKFQTNFGSVEGLGNGNGGGTGGGGIVPEPAVLLLLGLGLIATATRVRLRQ